MKKFLMMGALAMALAVLSTQQAPAWINVKFNAGLNYGYQAGGNNLLWGAFRNGQPPGPDGCSGFPQSGPGFYPQSGPGCYPQAPGIPTPAPLPYHVQDQGSAVNNNAVTEIPAATGTTPATGSSYNHQAWYNQMVNYRYGNPTAYNYGYYR